MCLIRGNNVYVNGVVLFGFIFKSDIFIKKG